MITIQAGTDTLRVYPEGKNYPMYHDAIYSSLDDKLFTNPVARDLVRIGQAIFAGDRSISRSMRIGQQTRDIRIELALEKPQLFKSAINELIDFVSFCTRDNWEFKFTLLRNTKSNTAKQTAMHFEKYDAVALFSDGLDSLCGAARLIRSGAHPVFISHFQPRWGHSSATYRLAQLAAALRREKDAFPSISIRFDLSDKNKTGRYNYFPEYSRRSRPCLYLSYASAVAVEYGIPQILMHENGILAMNLPYSKSHFGALVSRHAHPLTMFRLQNWLRKIWPHKTGSPSVDNPFFGLTKADQVGQFCRNLPAGLVEATSSCENASRSLLNYKGNLRAENVNARTDFTQCGVCIPCLIRRQALMVNGFEERTNYAFPWEGPTGKKRKLAPTFVNDNLSILENYCRQVVKSSESQFIQQYFSELSILSECYNEVGGVFTKIYQLQQRFAKQYLKTIDSL